MCQAPSKFFTSMVYLDLLEDIISNRFDMKKTIYSVIFLLSGCYPEESIETVKPVVNLLPEQVITPTECEITCAVECEKEVFEEVQCKQEVVCAIE